MSGRVPTKCGNGKRPRNKKSIAYGEQREATWCGCDVEHANKVSKKSARQKAKKQIRKETQAKEGEVNG